jgi:hypothetical protein
MATEGGFDAGAASVCLLSAGLIWAGARISVGILLSLLGAVAIVVLLRRYYGAIDASLAAA